MVPVAGYPLVRYAIRTVADLGVRDVYIVLSPNDSLTPKYIQTLKIPRLRLLLSFQDYPSGLADAISTVVDRCPPQFYVVLGDDITIATNLSGLGRPIQLGLADAVQATVRDLNPVNIKESCGVVFNKKYAVTKFQEKPGSGEFSYRGIGVYAFSREIFDHRASLFGDGLPKLDSILQRLVLRHRFYAHPITGVNINVNRDADRERAEKYLARHRLDF